MTAPYVDGFEQPSVGDQKNFVSKHQRREIISEHAVTVGLLGETVVARQVVLGEITPDQAASASIRASQFQIAIAYDLAKIGTNQYYAARLARLGMRTEHINGRPLNILPWFGRLSASVVRALLRDRGNLLAAAAQFEQARRQTLSQEAAFAATSHWRTV